MVSLQRERRSRYGRDIRLWRWRLSPPACSGVLNRKWLQANLLIMCALRRRSDESILASPMGRRSKQNLTIEGLATGPLVRLHCCMHAQSAFAVLAVAAWLFAGPAYARGSPPDGFR